jgi:hypothetical protein
MTRIARTKPVSKEGLTERGIVVVGFADGACVCVCSYDLGGLPASARVCPECGRELSAGSQSAAVDAALGRDLLLATGPTLVLTVLCIIAAALGQADAAIALFVAGFVVCSLWTPVGVIIGVGRHRWLHHGYFLTLGLCWFAGGLAWFSGGLFAAVVGAVVDATR